MRTTLLCLAAAISMVSFTYGNNADQKAMIHDLKVAKQIFETKYAPKAWKKEYFGWTLNDSFQKAIKKVENSPTIKEYQQIFKEFILSTKDYHVNVGFYSTARNWYPLMANEVDGHYYVSKQEANLPFDFIFYKSNIMEPDDTEESGDPAQSIASGDEIVAIDGKPVRSVIEALIDKYRGGDRTPTGYAIACKLLFNNAEDEPEYFTLTVIPQGSDTPVEHRLRWYQIPEWIDDQPLHKDKKQPELPDASLLLDLKKGS